MNRLTEATRQELILKSRRALPTKTYGTTRYDRRTKQHIYNSVSNFNKIDMNRLFKGNMLSFKIPVHGETDNYSVEVLFEGILDDIKHEIKVNKDKLEYKCIYRAIINAINKQDIYISCSCPDWKYRMRYYATKNRYNSGVPQVKASDITNPNDKLGAGCKHSLAVLGNLDWAMKLATVIHNYIIYMQENDERKFADIIFPAIYDMTYNKAVQLGLFDDDELANTMDNEDTGEIDAANERSIYKPKETEPVEDEEEIEQTELKFNRKEKPQKGITLRR